MNTRITQLILAGTIWIVSLTPAMAQQKAGSAESQDRSSDERAKTEKLKPSPSPGSRLAQELGEELKAETFGFIDKDRDGINDRFADVNGDGINDLNGRPYFHRFMYIDANEDGVNDLFADADGDGVNDFDIRWVDKDTDGVCDNIIDTNGDGVNDITGLQFNRKSLRGYKFGWINEEREFLLRNFVDEDMDGLPDMHPMRLRGAGIRQPFDRFIDRDGDGIDDRRQPHQRLRRGGGGLPMGGPR